MANSDPFIGILVSSLQNYSTINSLGWTVIAQNSPNRKENDTVPCVLVVPQQKVQVAYIAFGQTKTVNSYDVYLLNTNNLSSDFTNNAQTLFQACLSNFMPQNAALRAAGAYMTRIVPKYDYDRTSYPRTWQSSCVTVNVFYVN